MPRAATPIPSPFDAALDALRADLERQRQDAIETEALIARLTKHAANGVAPNASSPAKRRRGRPPIISDDALRARKRDAMRARRARIRVAKAAAAAAQPAKPKAKPRKKAIVASSETKPAETAATKGKRKRRRRSTGGFKNAGVKAEISGWTTDADGNVCRSLVAEGERVPLKDERSLAT